LKGLDIEVTVWPGPVMKAILDLKRKEAFDLLVIGGTGHANIYEPLWDEPFYKSRGQTEYSILMVK
jgi:hypothetical protein